MAEIFDLYWPIATTVYILLVAFLMFLTIFFVLSIAELTFSIFDGSIKTALDAGGFAALSFLTFWSLGEYLGE